MQDSIGERSIRDEHSSGEQTTNRRESHVFYYPEGPLFLERKLFDRFISIRRELTTVLSINSNKHISQGKELGVQGQKKNKILCWRQKSKQHNKRLL
ncbi:hypothetical protein H6P81_020326 [Aristolochia fimbriata]|uniref:Uncharacterized protein n=1 Tax=Aristolochia fimbriata TaxID=158543 RepID=A0AAV7DX45_ARIFI|nr:hypothetical protein H6P81_020326 [Aristolochia fimbriata]